MKVLTILGTRPEIIRLSRIIPQLDRMCQHVLVHTGQNFEASLSDVFFHELGVRQADHVLGVRGETFGQQIGQILIESERVMLTERPDRLLILGDTNSGLSAIVAKRLGIQVYHMEAGNRCYDDRVPEETNRRIIDHSSDILMPYTERSRANLLREGLPGDRIYVTGNPIFEVMQYYDAHIQKSNVLATLGVEARHYFLVTMHRAENVDIESRLRGLIAGLDQLQRDYNVPIIISTHPRAKARMQQFGLDVQNANIRLMPPFGFFDFIALEKNALCALSDSGTVQEECCILGVPNVTIRDTTERPETIEVGSNILSGVESDRIQACVRVALGQKGRWTPPWEYVKGDVTSTVVKIVLG
jgi:UDP-N-acetylglucosamine 2-epimerase (non-hydrolysing)